MPNSLLLSAFINSLSTKLPLNVLNSPSVPYFFTLSSLISGLLFFCFFVPSLPLIFPSLLLLSCAQSFWTMLPLLCTSPWKARRSELSLPVGGRGTVRGYQYTNTKQYPIVTLLSVFYNGKLAAPRTSSDSEAQSGLLTEQEQNWLM